MYSHRAVHLLALFTVGVSSGTWFYEVMCSVCADDGNTDLAHTQTLSACGMRKWANTVHGV